MAKRRKQQSKESTAETTKPQGSDDVKLDLSGLTKRFSTVKTETWVVLLLILIAVFLACYFRSYPANLPITDQWAQNSVDRYYQSQIRQGIDQQFPNLPDDNKNKMIAEQYAKFKQQNKQQIDQQVKGTSQEFKSRMKNDNGETYLLAIDPWTYYMEAHNILRNGHPGDTLKDGKPWLSVAGAPFGAPAGSNLHSHVQLWTWRILSIFFPSMSLMGGAFWVPVIIAGLSIIPAFFIVRRKVGNLGGFVAAVLLAVHGAYLNRTPGGFSDTDAYNILFPLIVAWLFLEAFETDDLKQKFLFAGGAGLALGIYSKIWVGWWYIFDIIICAIVAYVLFVLIKYLIAKYRGKRVTAWWQSDSWKNIANTLMLSAAFIGITAIMITIFYNFQAFLNLPLQAIGFSQLKVPANPTLWPNVLTTVAELNEVSFAGVVGQMGGKFLFVLAILGVGSSLLPFTGKLKPRDYTIMGITFLFALYLISNSALQMNIFTYLLLLSLPLIIGLVILLTDNRSIDIKYMMLILLWFVGTLYATTKGIRFTLVLVPAFTIAIGTFVGMLYQHLSKLLTKELELPKRTVMIVLAIVLCAIIILMPIKNANAVALNEVPSMNDAWYDSLISIKENSQPDAIITSWWDFGHWFKAVAERPVTFDGGSQNTPMAHWVGKLLLTDNERESQGILRMLDCGSSRGFDRLREALGEPYDDSLKTKALMDELVLLDHDEAKVRLEEEGLTAEQIDGVLEYTHCEPPEAFLITSTDMVGKAGVWGHFGSWSFERAYIYNALRKRTQAEATQVMKEKLGYTQEEADRTYIELQGLLTERAANTWLSPWPSYASDWSGCLLQNGTVNLTAMGIESNHEIEERELAVCPTNFAAGSQQGTNVRVEAVIIDLEHPEQSRLRYAFYRNGIKISQNDEGKPTKLVIAHADTEEGLTTIEPEGATAAIGFLYDEENQRLLAADPLLIDSIFTQLYYLDGKYMSDYIKFSDKTSFNGQRIIIWTVDWGET